MATPVSTIAPSDALYQQAPYRSLFPQGPTETGDWTVDAAKTQALKQAGLLWGDQVVFANGYVGTPSGTPATDLGAFAGLPVKQGVSDINQFTKNVILPGMAAVGIGGVLAGNKPTIPTIPGTPGGGSDPGGTGGGGGGGTGGGGTGGLSSGLFSDIVNAFLGLAGTELATNASKQAQQAQLDAINKATALQQSMYQQSRSDQLPWLKAGTGALQLLEQGLGLPNVNIPNLAFPSTASAPTAGVTAGAGSAVPAGAPPANFGTISPNSPTFPGPTPTSTGSNTLNSLAATPPTDTGLAPVPMQTPTGAVVQIPANMVAEAQARGARRI